MSVDFDEYEKLESENVAVVTRQDLPDEFGDKDYEVIVEFIRKTGISIMNGQYFLIMSQVRFLGV